MQPETLFEQLLFTTVHISTKDSTGNEGCGTGFIYSVQTGPNQVAQMLVTNKHVIEDAATAEIRFIAATDPARKEANLGTCHTITLSEGVDSFFEGHPNPDIDIAVAPISGWIQQLAAQGHHVFFVGLNPSIAMTDENTGTLDAIEEITFIGYPNGLYDRVNFLPIARRGYTATHPAINYGGKPVFLVDASVFPGSSGSPVLIASLGNHFSREGTVIMGGVRVMLLGIVAAVHQRAVPILELPTAVKSITAEAVDLGVVYKAQAIDETVDLLFGKLGIERYAEQPEGGTTPGQPTGDDVEEAA